MASKTRSPKRNASRAARNRHQPKEPQGPTREELSALLKSMSSRLEDGSSIAEVADEVTAILRGLEANASGVGRLPDNVVPIRPGIPIVPPKPEPRKTPVQQLLDRVAEDQDEFRTVIVIAEPKTPMEEGAFDHVRLFYATTDSAGPFHLLGLFQSAVMALWSRL